LLLVDLLGVLLACRLCFLELLLMMRLDTLALVPAAAAAACPGLSTTVQL
jgi:hypothetical protein